MIKVQPFTIDVLATHKVFFLLDKLPKNLSFVDISIQTPTGTEPVDFVDLFLMQDGSLIAAWSHPLQKLGLQNLVASVGEESQILNLYPVERIIDVYDKPVDSDYGVFVFTRSGAIPNPDWRCDRGYYGAQRFVETFADPVVTDLKDIIMYESFLSVAGAGHLIYMEIAKNTDFADEKLNNSVVPTTGRTFQEVLRLVYEWAVLAKEPFNSTHEAAVAAKGFLDALNFSASEISEIENETPMQVAQFLMGSESARVRPTNINPTRDAISNILFSRMASSSLSFIVSRNPEIWDLEQVVTRELEELENGIQRFKTYYGLTTTTDMDDYDMVVEVANFWYPHQASYIHNQLRHFANKKKILNEIPRS